VEAFDSIKQILASVEEDVAKAVGGNKAAQTRVRKAMQDVKDAAQQVRVGMLEFRDDGKKDEPKKD
jgi:hypothetical protein